MSDARTPPEDESAAEGLDPHEQYAVLLRAILGAPVTSYRDEPRDGKASGPYIHTWYPDLLYENDERPE
jgi:hypothetical protein